MNSDGVPATGLEGHHDRLSRLTPQQRAAFIERTRRRPPEGPPAAAIPRRQPGQAAPLLSFSQERLWFLEQLSPGSGVFNEYVALRLDGDLDVAALSEALQNLARRHEALRTVVDATTMPPSQVVREDIGPVLQVVDLAGAGDPEAAALALAEQESARPFDLAAGPLLRVLLIRSAPQRALLVFINHHLIGDAWSRSILLDELCARYRALVADAATAAHLPDAAGISYADWAIWQRRELTDEALSGQLDYWERQLAGAPPLLSLPTDRPRPAVPSHQGARLYLNFDVGTTGAVERLARTGQASPFMVTLAAWQAMLMRYCGQEDVVVGVPVSGREHPQVERVVGMFANSLVMRCDLSGDPTFTELVGRVRGTALDAFANARVSFDRLVHRLRPERDLSYAPLYQVQFGYRNVPAGDMDLPGVAVVPVELDNGVCRTDLSLELAQVGNQTVGICEFSRDLFDEDSVRGFLGAFERVLHRGAEAPETHLSELLALTGDERATLVALGAGPPLPGPAEDVLARFDQAVLAHPDGEALVSVEPSGAKRLTYAELAARTDWIASRLHDAGVRAGDRVGICLRRDADLPAAMLAVLRAGAAYLPLDPGYPPARLGFVVGDAAPAAVVVHAATRSLVPDGPALIDLDSEAGPEAGAPAASVTPAGPAEGGDALAYVIYTSGSTGTPKGVMVGRRNLAAFLAAMDAVVSTAGVTMPTWLAVTSASFDIAVLELLWTLSRGHRVIIAPDSDGEPVAAAAGAQLSMFFFAADTSATAPGEEQYRMLLEAARFADEHGFAAVWLPERHFHAFGGAFPAPAVLAAALAATTRTVRIRAGSVVIPLHNPVRVAEEWAVVDNLTGGRAGLSFASGWHSDDFVLAPDAYHIRRERMLEGIDQVRRLWRGERLSMPGPDGHSVEIGTLPRPVQAELPFWVTSSGNVETFRLAGELGAGLLTHMLGQSLPELATRIGVYRDSYQAAGHPGAPHVTLMLHTYVGADQADIDAHARGPFREYLRSSTDLIGRMARAQGSDPSSAGFTDDDLEALLDHACARYLREASLIGTRDQCQAMVTAVSELGVDEIACLIDFGVPTAQALSALGRLEALRTPPGALPGIRVPGTARYPQLIRQYGVTHLQCTPSLARALLELPDPQALAGLHQILLGGEALGLDLVRRLAEHTNAAVLNMYGPTETTVWSTMDAVDLAEGIVTIGRPIAGTTVRVVDRNGQPVPPGVAGELCVGGAGVSAGYLGGHAQTAERFLDDPLQPGTGARIYRTGDMVRMRRDGRLEFLHRGDDQVKIRGFRVEPAEVEAELLALPAVRECAVVAYGLGTSQAGLAAYVVAAAADSPPSPAQLRAALAGRLPAFLVPSRFTVRQELPRTLNGKLDRAALARAAEHQAAPASAPPAASATSTEARIAHIWQEALGVGRIGVDDDFFDAGGHSLLAIEVIALIRDEFGIDLALRTLFEAPTVSQLAGAVDALASGASQAVMPAPQAEPPPVGPAADHDQFPLTDVQRAYWIGRSDVRGAGVACHLYLELDIPALDLPRLEACWQRLIRRHGALRLVFTDDGYQRILPEPPAYRIHCADLRSVSADDRNQRLAAVRETMSHQVLPAGQWPLFELRVSQLGGGRDRLHLSIDALIMDGASVRILLRELLAAYQGLPDPPPLTMSFRDYVLSEQARRAGPGYDRDVQYWRDRVERLPPAPQLPLARRLEQLGQARFQRREAVLPAGLWAELKARAAKARLTPSALALAAYATVLGMWSASDAFTINVTLFSREGRHPGLARLVGDFTALVLLGVDGATTGSFADRARRLQERLWEDLDHRLVSGVWVAAELARQRGAAQAVMPVVFTSELGGAGTDTAGVLREMDCEQVYAITQTPQVWLDHQIAEDGGELRLTWDSVDELFPEGMVGDMFDAYTGLLTGLAADPGAWTDPVQLPIPARHAQAYRALNDTGGQLPAGLLHEPFLRQASRHPDRTAVISATRTISYGGLLEAADAVARAVVRAGARPGEVVGVLANRDWHQVAGVLGVLRAGCAYLPLDQQLPPARVAGSLWHAGATVLVAAGPAAVPPVPDGCAIVTVDQAVAAGDAAPVPVTPMTSGDLAYVVYTSGSTGEPKGVMISHQAALNTITDINERFGLGPHDRLLGLSSLGFDLSVYDIFGTLAAGAALVLAGDGEEHDPIRWKHLMSTHGVTVWNSVPALMEMLLVHADGAAAADFGQLRLVLLSGDWIPVAMPGQIRAVAPDAVVISLGGATEAAIWSVLHPISEQDRTRPSIPYGRPLRNQRTYVYDDAMRLRPCGVPGALYIGGAGVALGYRADDQRTALAFPAHPVTGERLYRTGDLARLLPGGDLEFLGREDGQVKINGMRIELGEVEAALVRAAGVREAVAAVAGSGISARLIAYVVREPRAQRTAGPALDADRLRHLELRLRQPGRRSDLAGHQAVPLTATADAGRLREVAAGLGSATGFGPGPVPLPDVHALLLVLARQDGDGVPKYAYGSANGLYPVQTYLAVAEGGIDGMEPGTYYLDPAGPCLIQVSERAAAGRGALDPLLYGEANQSLVAQAQFGIFLIGRESAIVPHYGDLAERLAVLEAGAMAQLIRQRAAECQLAVCPIGDVYPDPLRDLFHLEEGQQVLHTLVGGQLPAGAAQAASGPAGWTSQLRAALAEQLPRYLVPDRIEVIDALPRSANGKVDRAALAAPPLHPAPALAPPARPGPPAAAGGVLATVAQVWCEVLETPTVDVDTNLFELGANSIQLVRVQRRVIDELGIELSIIDLLDHPTVRLIAQLLERPGSGPAPPADPGPARPAGARKAHHQRSRAVRRDGPPTPA